MRTLLAIAISCLFIVSAKTFAGNTARYDQSYQVYFVFNQPKYAPGDTAFFAGYLMNENTRLYEEKKIINLKLIDAKGREVLHNRLLFDKGLCRNQLFLPDDFVPGIYTLVAFADGDMPDKDEASLFYQADFVVTDEHEFIERPNNHNQAILIDSVNAGMTSKSLHLKVDFDKTVYGTRESAQATIAITDLLDRRVSAHVSVTILQNNIFKDHTTPSLIRCAVCDHTVTKKNAQHSEKKIYPYFFRGTVVTENNQPIPDSTFATFYLSEEDFIYGVYLKKGGAVEFPLFKDFSAHEVFYKISHRNMELKGAKIILDNPVYTGEPLAFVQSQDKDFYGSYVTIKKMVERSYNFYTSEKTEKRKIDDLMNDDDVDYIVDLRKFESFPTMAEVLGNIVQAVKYRKSKNEDEVRVFLKELGYYATADPVYIIDGIMTDNTDYFLSINPADVSRIGVARSRAKLSRFGFLGAYGIVVIETTIANHSLKMPRTENSLQVTKINPETKFHAVRNFSEFIPNVNAALYWNPNLVISTQAPAKIDFFTSDATGDFLLKIEGFADDGVPVFYKINFNVEYKPSVK